MQEVTRKILPTLLATIYTRTRWTRIIQLEFCVKYTHTRKCAGTWDWLVRKGTSTHGWVLGSILESLKANSRRRVVLSAVHISYFHGDTYKKLNNKVPIGRFLPTVQYICSIPASTVKMDVQFHHLAHLSLIYIIHVLYLVTMRNDIAHDTTLYVPYPGPRV